MIVGFDGSRAFLKERTGTENYSYQLLRNLAKIDIENSYKVYIRPGLEIDSKDWPSNFEFVTINLPRLWTQVGLAFKTFTDKLDLLFIPAHTLPLIKRPNLKTIVTVHDLGVEFLPAMHQVKQRLYLNLMTNYQLRSADKIIAVSESTKNDLIKKAKVKAKDIKVIYEGVDTKVFKQIKGDVLVNSLKHFGVEKNNYFLFVGTIQPRKNLKRLIKAFGIFLDRNNREGNSKSVANLKLVLAGGKGWLADEIYSLPKKMGIEDKVKFLGRVDDKHLPALYSGALGFVYPSLYEGFGLPILEAMSCQVPVLSSKVSSIPEVSGEAAILVNPESIEEIVEGMNKLLDKEVRIKLTRDGLVQVQKFSWERCARETLKLIVNS